jgi:hypothetical protein
MGISELQDPRTWTILWLHLLPTFHPEILVSSGSCPIRVAKDTIMVTMPRASEKFRCGMGDRKTFSTMIKRFVGT